MPIFITTDRIKDGSFKALVVKINTLSALICQLEHFKQIIRDVALHVDEIRGTVVSSHAPTAESLKDVTEELVRATFYDTMLEHTKKAEIIPLQLILEEDYWVHYVLTAHVLIETLVSSRTLEKAIALNDKKALTLANCPGKYSDLAPVIIGLKVEFPYLKPQEIAYIKYRTIPGDAEIAIPAEVAKAVTPGLDLIAGKIEFVANRVSEFATFREILRTVLDRLKDKK